MKIFKYCISIPVPNLPSKNISNIRDSCLSCLWNHEDFSLSLIVYVTMSCICDQWSFDMIMICLCDQDLFMWSWLVFMIMSIYVIISCKCDHKLCSNLQSTCLVTYRVFCAYDTGTETLINTPTNHTLHDNRSLNSRGWGSLLMIMFLSNIWLTRHQQRNCFPGITCRQKNLVLQFC